MTMRWNGVHAACGQVSRPRPRAVDHHALQEHAEVEPAALPHDPVDREHHADRRVEEAVVARVLRCIRALSVLAMPSRPYRSQPTLRRRSMNGDFHSAG
jgi:hypothetical protein